MRRRPLRAGVAGLSAAAGLLAGCASIPDTSSPRVVEHFDPSRGLADQDVLQDTRPGIGLSEQQVAAGFIQTQSQWQDGHEPVRRFLTTRASAAWRDDVRITVTDSTPKVGLPAPDHSVSVTFTPVGTVGHDGSYQPVLGPPEPTTVRLDLRKQDGEWRIDDLPDGTLLSRTQFEQLYHAYTLYFLDPSGGRLVADRRYLPDNPGNVLQQLIRRLFDGPSEWLLPVVGNALAPPVTLNEVTLDHQVVHIDVSGLNAQVSDTRQGAVAQLVWTLTQLPGAFGVQVTSEGRRVELRDVTSAVLSNTDLPRYDPDALPDLVVGGTSRPDTPTQRGGGTGGGGTGVQAYYVRDGGVYTLDGKQVLNGRYKLSAVGVSTDLQQLAGIGPAPGSSKVTVLLGRLKGTLRASAVRATTLSRPTWDRATGTFWTVADGSRILSVSLDGQVRQISLNAGWPNAPEGSAAAGALGRLGPLRLSRDGTRVAFAAGAPGRMRLYVGRVHSTGDAVTIERAIPITPALVDVRDVAWESASTLVVLAATIGEPVAPYRVLADGSSIEPGRLPVPDGGVVTITAAPDSPPVVSSAADGGTLSQNQGTWVSPGRGPVRGVAPTYPG